MDRNNTMSYTQDVLFKRSAEVDGLWMIGLKEIMLVSLFRNAFTTSRGDIHQFTFKKAHAFTRVSFD
jgi:hypothetical protein